MKAKKNLLSVCILLMIAVQIAFSPSSSANPLANWREVTSPSDHWFYGMTYGNSGFVTVGDYGTILTSPDGVVWTLRTSGDTHHLNGVGYGNNTYIAVGEVGTILTSPDGITWTLRDAGVGRYTLNAATYGNGLFVVVGSSGEIVTTSGDPNWIWSDVSVPTSNWLFGVVYGSQFVGVGSLGEINYSAAGASWSRVTPASTNKHLYGVTYGNGIFVAVGQYGIVLTSVNGINWTLTRTPQSYYEDLYGVAFGTVGGFGYFVAVGQASVDDVGTVLTSPDGVNWTYRDSKTKYDLEAVACNSNNHVFAAVGGYGIIILDGDSLPVEPVWIPRVHSMYRGASLQEAYYNAFDGDPILSMALHFDEDLIFNNPIGVSLEGGYDAEFVDNPSATTVNGSLTITSGTVTVENVIIQ